MTEQLLTKAFETKEKLTPRTIVAFDTTGKVKTAAASTDKAIGIALSGGNVNQGAFADILLQGIAEVKVGAAVAVGDSLHWDTSSRAIKATSGKTVIAIALESATAENGVIRVLIQHGKA